VTLANGTLSGFSGSGTSYTATFTADDGFDGTGTVTVPAGSYTDAAGNSGAVGSDNVDTSLTDSDNNSVVNFTSSEATTDFVEADVTLANGDALGF